MATTHTHTHYAISGGTCCIRCGTAMTADAIADARRGHEHWAFFGSSHCAECGASARNWGLPK